MSPGNAPCLCTPGVIKLQICCIVNNELSLGCQPSVDTVPCPHSHFCCSSVTCVGKVTHPPQLFPVAVQVACGPPSLRSCLCILDPLLEVPQCSGEGAGHTLGFGLPLLLPQISSIPQKCLCCILAVLCSLLLSLQFCHWYQHGSAALPIAHPSLQLGAFSLCIAHSRVCAPLQLSPLGAMPNSSTHRAGTSLCPAEQPRMLRPCSPALGMESGRAKTAAVPWAGVRLP